MAPSGATTSSSVQALLQDAALAGTWALDPARSTVGLRSKSMWGLVTVKGAFGEISGTGTVSPAGDVSGTVTVGSASVNTGNKKRDTHLRSKDFFDSEAFPGITFRLDQLAPASEGATATGTLTVRDRTRPVSFPARVSVPGPGEVMLDAEVQVNRADFGLTWNQMGMTGMDNTITVHAVFTRA